ncbi:CotD family spore coat protein [Heyndrickxia sp. NPDC080065]|uniref:CotD family spore coat protein n=1 Tax=Heyndrickxia sp. NPDC080065 TaxID=3390568 RepID=UPI003D05EEBC
MFPCGCGPKVLPAVVHPTKCCVKHTQETFIQPHIYPSHTTNVNHEVIAHQNYYPHTESFVNEVSNVNLGPAVGPVPPYGPGPGVGPYPGMAPFGYPR